VSEKRNICKREIYFKKMNETSFLLNFDDNLLKGWIFCYCPKVMLPLSICFLIVFGSIIIFYYFFNVLIWNLFSLPLYPFFSLEGMRVFFKNEYQYFRERGICPTVAASVRLVNCPTVSSCMSPIDKFRDTRLSTDRYTNISTYRWLSLSDSFRPDMLIIDHVKIFGQFPPRTPPESDISVSFPFLNFVSRLVL